MKIRFPLCLVVTTVLFACYRFDVEVKRSAELISIENALIIDVRTEQEFERGHIQGAIHIPHSLIETNISKIGPDTSRAIVVYCEVGGKSRRS